MVLYTLDYGDFDFGNFLFGAKKYQIRLNTFYKCLDTRLGAIDSFFE